MRNVNPNKTKTKKIPLRLRLVLFWYKFLETVYTKGALKMAIKFFFRSFRTSRTSSQKELQKSSDLTYIDINGDRVNVYSWGDGKKVALLVHGWSGYALQYEPFVTSLLKKDYKVISFDAVAHGRSEGKETNVVDFITIIEKIIEEEKNIDLLMGHSLGGVAVSHFAFDSRVNRLGIISSPASSRTVMNTFKAKLNVSDEIIGKIEVYIKENFDRELSSFFPLELYKNKRPTKPTLLIQDETDKEFPITEHQELVKLFENPFSFISKGWGHTRLLENPAVIEAFSNFVDNVKGE